MKSWIEISAARLRENVEAVRAVAGPRFEVLAVIKADAYGHGAALCAPVLVEAGVRWLGVGDVEEGLRVRAALSEAGLAELETNLLVMCGFEPEDAAGIVEAGLTPVVWTPEHVEALERAARAVGKRVPVHLEIDTGMARQGAAVGGELVAVLKALRGTEFVRCAGVFSHLSSSEVMGSAETPAQALRFDEALVEAVTEAGVVPGYLHMANSSGVDEGSTLLWMSDMAAANGMKVLVRPGLAVYGYALPLKQRDEVDSQRRSGMVLGAPDTCGALRPRLQPVATWKTRVIGVREIAAGDAVGYGGTFVAPGPMRLALLPVGYADGFRREASSGVGDGWVMIAGRKAPVVGRVSMNLTVVDVTGFPQQVIVGDEVVLLGEGVTADDQARWCGTIPYEILCGMRGHRQLV